MGITHFLLKAKVESKSMDRKRDVSKIKTNIEAKFDPYERLFNIRLCNYTHSL